MFDQERALRAWEALVTKQQNALEALKVPTMFSTGNQSDMEVSVLSARSQGFLISLVLFRNS